ncbi:DUF6508 domain-containing protein [Cecembia calidifontis]|jgi:hypothetical protein|uniref:Uncharacterized protein n=1 Tax=Cecembia calidifontis TaxID=1187080 RepID=A0A4Q7PEZ9_9BACT|nr:DUF6508 domain-containing protein [Cecembia calidifontis]RZS98240.1 hypothetical protein BC751_3880 [Cecembia calidifontis]
MKPVFTPLEEIGFFLEGEKGKHAVLGLSPFVSEIEGQIEKIKKAVPVHLTEGSLQKYLDMDGIKTELKRYISESGLLVGYDWEDWMEGKEILDGVRPFAKINKIKACKLLTLILKRDESQFGYFESHLKKGSILILLKKLLEQEVLN